MAEKKTTQSSSSNDNKGNATAVLSYLWILCFIPLLAGKKSEFTQFHAKQGFTLFLLSLITFVPFFGQLLGFALLVVSIIAILKTWDGEKWKIPYVYEWSKIISKKFNL